MGKDAKKLARVIDTKVPIFFARNMSEAVKKAASCARNKDTVLLSPACASLDQYLSYAQRGESFCSAVKELEQ